MRAFLFRLALAAGFLAAPAGLSAAWAQSGGFAPVVTVNGAPVSGYELQQRILFMQLLRTPGDIAEQARTSLIEDRLRTDAARRMGIKLTPDQVKQGMEEFASRANLTADQFVAAIAQGGVEPETFRDFVTAGLIWREVIRKKYAGGVTISEAEVDRALALTSQRGDAARVLLAEIVVPAIAGDMQGAMRKATKLAEGLQGEVAFARAARENSAAPSRRAGGKLGWIPLSNLPANVRPLVAQLRPGQITPPVPVPGGVALFQMRALDQSGANAPANVTVDYAQYLLPGGAAEAAGVRAAVDTCDDLYTLARKTGKDRLTRVRQAAAQVPGDIARELATLDENEASTALSRGGSTVFLMLCARSATGEATLPGADAAAAAGAEVAAGAAAGAPSVREGLGFGAGPNREALKQELLNQRLNGLSDDYMAELKASAVISEP